MSELISVAEILKSWMEQHCTDDAKTIVNTTEKQTPRKGVFTNGSQREHLKSTFVCEDIYPVQRIKHFLRGENKLFRERVVFN